MLFIARQSLYCSNQVSVLSDEMFLLKIFTPYLHHLGLRVVYFNPDISAKKSSFLRIPSGVSMKCEILYSVSPIFFMSLISLLFLIIVPDISAQSKDK